MVLLLCFAMDIDAEQTRMSPQELSIEQTTMRLTILMRLV